MRTNAGVWRRRERKSSRSARTASVRSWRRCIGCCRWGSLPGEAPLAGEPILIVDDNPQNLKLARVILTAEGYQVKTAVDAEDALTVLESFAPRVILMDLQLPRMDGLALTRQLKHD